MAEPTHSVHSETRVVSHSRVQSLVLILVFVTAVVLMLLFFKSFPSLSDSDMSSLRFPRSLADVHQLAHVLKQYRDKHFDMVILAFCATYIFLQTFAIPGAVFLSILAGPLFGVWRGLLLVSVVATSGSCLCFTISNVLAKGLVQQYMPNMINNFRSKVDHHRHNLFFYLLFLRISPLLPNWFISVSSPLLHIPLSTFAMATLFGLLPANYLHVSTGVALERLEAGAVDGQSTVDVRALAMLFFAAFFALLPTLCRKKMEKLDQIKPDEKIQ